MYNKGIEPTELFKHLKTGDIEALARAITLIESGRPSDRIASNELLNLSMPFQADAFVVGITGVPGVGKSTFINGYGMRAIEKGYKVAVLAIDPSSKRSKGSIMGDKTRMDDLSVHPNAFIRPSPTSGKLGGISRRTREAALLCAAAGFDRILIESVGVGQNELLIDDLSDLTLLLLLAGAGDELQGIKRGIMEAADVLAINKADSGNDVTSQRAAMQLRNALSLLPTRESGLRAKVFTCSARDNSGINEIFDHVESMFAELLNNGTINKKRVVRNVRWMKQRVEDAVLDQLRNDERIRDFIQSKESELNAGSNTPIAAADEILRLMGIDPETLS